MSDNVKYMNMKYRILSILASPFYFIAFLIFSIAFFFFYSYFQVFGLIDNIGFWISTLNIYQLLFVFALSLLFGLSFSYQLYLLKNPICIEVKDNNKETKNNGKLVKNTFHMMPLSSLSFISTLLVSTCPTCLTLAVFILPASMLTILSKYTWEINIIAISIVLFALYKNGAFDKIEN
ncbi:MAG: hypothetical protein QXS91_02125 [Candidatus Anstonellales archaeon]